MTQAFSTSVIDTNSCQQLTHKDQPFILVLKRGENLFESILHCANTLALPSATISGLGALDEVTLAYYHLHRKQYDTQLFPGTYELISLNGNITFFEGKRFLHIHAALGGPNYEVVGGHMMDATVGPSAEITITPLANPINRLHNDSIGLKLICPMSP